MFLIRPLIHIYFLSALRPLIEVTIRMLAKTFPLKQWEVARELRRRIKVRLDQEGIQVPYPHRVVITRPAAPTDSA